MARGQRGCCLQGIGAAAKNPVWIDGLDEMERRQFPVGSGWLDLFGVCETLERLNNIKSIQSEEE